MTHLQDSVKDWLQLPFRLPACIYWISASLFLDLHILLRISSYIRWKLREIRWNRIAFFLIKHLSTTLAYALMEKKQKHLNIASQLQRYYFCSYIFLFAFSAFIYSLFCVFVLVNMAILVLRHLNWFNSKWMKCRRHCSYLIVRNTKQYTSSYFHLSLCWNIIKTDAPTKQITILCWLLFPKYSLHINMQKTHNYAKNFTFDQYERVRSDIHIHNT